jgi:uncharacterized protein (DUF1330 family)
MQKQTRTRALYAFGLVAVFALGYAAAELQDNAAHAAALAGEKAAYLIVSSRVVDPEPLAAYGEAAGPGARKAGVEVLARADVGDGLEVLEGAWPHNDGGVTIERFTSMQALLDFWHSDEYQAAKKLREGALDVDFIVALEAVEATTTE